MARDTARAATGEGRPSAPGYWVEIVLGRLVPALIFSVFIVDKALLSWDSVVSLSHSDGRAQPTDYFVTADHLLGLLVFATVAGLFIFRLPRKSGDRRPLVIAVSFFGTFAVLATGYLPNTSPGLYAASTLVIAIGLAITFWGLFYLRWSFSIMPEARHLVTGGPYSLSRNPVYIGEFVAAVGVSLPHTGLASICLLAALGLAQYIRILWEERVLAREFSAEYAAYRRRVPQLLPVRWKQR